MRSSSRKIIQNMDMTAFALYMILVLFGLATIYSSAYTEEFSSIFSFEKEYGKQIIWILVSLLMGGVVINLDTDFFSRFSFFIYGFVLLLLVGVLFTPPINGARSWFHIGAFSLQPSEFAKYATALCIAQYLTLPTTRLKDFSSKIVVTLLIGIPGALITLQPDPGTLLVFVSFIFVFYREGLSGGVLLFSVYCIALGIITLFYQGNTTEVFFSSTPIESNYLIIVVVSVLTIILFWLIKKFVTPRYRKSQYLSLFGAYAISLMIIFSANWAFNNVLKDRHRDRIDIMLGKKIDRKGAGYNIFQAMSAIGSGGFNGKGFKSAELSNDQYKHVPEQSTDFIFCSLAEEWGFIGTTIVIITFLALIFKSILIAERQRSRFARIYAYSVGGILFFHFMINIGMVIGLAPVIGIPLPFFSYGGSSIIGFSLLIFTMLKLDAERLDVLR